MCGWGSPVGSSHGYGFLPERRILPSHLNHTRLYGDSDARWGCVTGTALPHICGYTSICLTKEESWPRWMVRGCYNPRTAAKGAPPRYRKGCVKIGSLPACMVRAMGEPSPGVLGRQSPPPPPPQPTVYFPKVPPLGVNGHQMRRTLHGHQMRSKESYVHFAHYTKSRPWP